MEEKEIIRHLQHPKLKKIGFTALMEQHQQLVYHFARKMLVDHNDALDATQNVFIKAWNGIDKFKGQSKMSTWLFRITHNECIDLLRQRKRLAGVALENIEKELPQVLQADQRFTGDEIERQLQVAIARLPEKQKAVFLLRYFEEKSYAEMSEITQTSVGALKASYHHAVKKIEEYLTREEA